MTCLDWRLQVAAQQSRVYGDDDRAQRVDQEDRGEDQGDPLAFGDGQDAG